MKYDWVIHRLTFFLIFCLWLVLLLRPREALTVNERERKSNSSAAVTYNHKHLELLSHLIFSQYLLCCPFIPTLCPQVISDDVWLLIAGHCGSPWSKIEQICRVFKEAELLQRPQGRGVDYLSLYGTDYFFSLASAVPLLQLPFPAVIIHSAYP